MLKKVLFLHLILLLVPVLFADEPNDETMARILSEAVSISVHSEILVKDNEKYWESDVTKVTIPGRSVTLLFKTPKEKLSIELTPFKREEKGSYMLTAVSQLWHEDEQGAQFRSSFKSIDFTAGELILFYPLGLKTQEALTGGNLHMEMGIRIVPYVREEKTE